MNLSQHKKTPHLTRGKLLRCCLDTLQHEAPDNPVEGLEIPCNWCSDNMRWTDGAWTPVRMLEWPQNDA